MCPLVKWLRVWWLKGDIMRCVSSSWWESVTLSLECRLRVMHASRVTNASESQLIFFPVHCLFVWHTPLNFSSTIDMPWASVFIWRLLTLFLSDFPSENKPKNGGICVANHTSPIDVIILASDGCYAMVMPVFLWEGLTCRHSAPILPRWRFT